MDTKHDPCFPSASSPSESKPLLEIETWASDHIESKPFSGLAKAAVSLRHQSDVEDATLPPDTKVDVPEKLHRAISEPPGRKAGLNNLHDE